MDEVGWTMIQGKNIFLSIARKEYKKRLFEEPKIEYSLRALKSLIRSVIFSKTKYPNIKFKTIIVDDKSKEENLSKIKELIDGNGLDMNITPLNHKKYKDTIIY